MSDQLSTYVQAANDLYKELVTGRLDLALLKFAGCVPPVLAALEYMVNNEIESISEEKMQEFIDATYGSNR